MDDEKFWDDAFTRAAESDRGAGDFELADDVARGRRRVRRRQTILAGAAALAVTTVAGATLMLTAPGTSTEGVTQPAAGGDATPIFREPELTLEPAPGLPSPSETDAATAVGPDGQREDTEAWRNQLHDIVASVLDPQKEHLNYATRSLQSGEDGTGGIHLGIKLGWSVPGQPGEGLVQITLSTERGRDGSGCWEYDVGGCKPVLTKGGLRYDIGRGDDGAFVIVHEQPDGERVIVYVDPLFGGNSLVPVEDMSVTEADVLRVVQDDRLNLPPL